MYLSLSLSLSLTHTHTPSQVEGKTLPEVTEYYYYWKKYCSDEYRGRNRHVSEEVWVLLLSSEVPPSPRLIVVFPTTSPADRCHYLTYLLLHM